jgi:hypothetical protein
VKRQTLGGVVFCPLLDGGNGMRRGRVGYFRRLMAGRAAVLFHAFRKL